MFELPIVEVAIGLTFMFLVLSFCATAIVEALGETLQWRGRLLHAKLLSILGPELTAHFYSERRVADLASGAPPTEAPLSVDDISSSEISSDARAPGRLSKWLSQGKFSSTSLDQARELARRINARRLPSYIPESVFADVILDWLQGVSLPASLRPDGSRPQPIPFALAELWQRMNRRADGDQDKLRAELVLWFQQTTDRTSGEFKRKVRAALYAVGFALVIALNADAIRMSVTLYGNPQLRAQVAATAEEVLANCPTGTTNCPAMQDKMRAVLTKSAQEASSGLLGWNAMPQTFLALLSMMLGCCITVLAIGMGADFWFGALKKVVAIKNANSTAVSVESRPSQPSTNNQPDTPAPRSSAPREPIDISTIELAQLKGFQPLRFAESNVHAFWLAQFASLAYAREQEINGSSLMQLHGLGAKFISQSGTQAFVFAGPHCRIVAFRGTENQPDDWISDINVAHDSRPWNVEHADVCVHSGFRKALDAVWEPLFSNLKESTSPVWFTGHSLGGALAVLAAYRLFHCTGDDSPTIGGVYTFGQPRVGNEALSRSCSPILAQRIFRYVNSSDIVPLAPPPRPLEYSHLGHVRFFDASGRLHHERTLWERVAEQLEPSLREVVSGAAWGPVVARHLRNRIEDHAMAKYIQCLERIDSVQALRLPGA